MTVTKVVLIVLGYLLLLICFAFFNPKEFGAMIFLIYYLPFYVVALILAIIIDKYRAKNKKE